MKEALMARTRILTEVVTMIVRGARGRSFDYILC